MSNQIASDECCPKFNPEPWDGQEITWNNKSFVKDRVRNFFHIPLNFGTVMKRNMVLIEAAGAKSDEVLVLTDCGSFWGSDVYIDVTGDVPTARMAEISGTYMSKVFEGPYRDMGKWIKEMNDYTEAQGKKAKRIMTYYTTCPK